MGISLDWSVSPQPTLIDRKAGKVVWKRSNWTPRKGVDDIRISARYHYFSNAPCVDGCDGSEDRGYFSDWCGRSEYFSPAGQLGTHLQIDSKRLDMNDFDRILRAAALYPPLDDDATRRNPVAEMPEHLRLRYKLWLLRYLRNYLFAIHGHRFRDPGLVECFAGVEDVKRPFTAVENLNIEVIRKAEARLKPISKALDEKIKAREINDDIYTNLIEF